MRRILLILAALLGSPLAGAMIEESVDLKTVETLKGKNRVVVIFKSETESDFVDQQLEGLLRDRSAAEERRLRIVVVPPGSESLPIRRHFQVGEKEFFVLLLGLDGGVKLSSRTPVEGERLWRLIDGMPLRQRERGG